MIRIRHFLAFYLLTFLLLGLIPGLSLIFNDGSMDFSEAAEKATLSTGIVWTSNILSVIRLSTVEPILLLTLLGSMAPALAAFSMLVFHRNRGLWKRFFRRLLPYQSCGIREASLLYLGIFALLIPSLLFAFWFRTNLGADYESSFRVSSAMITSILVISFLDQGALLEELGWRGYAQTELQQIAASPLQAAIIVGIAWGLWHLPRDITTGVIERLGYEEYLLKFLPSFLLGTVSVSVIAIYFSNRLGGSVIPAIVVHGITNDSIGISGIASISEALTPFHQITKNLPFALIAMGLVMFSGRELGKLKDRG
jgi:membrane protease YdiL (CAAX protease family)